MEEDVGVKEESCNSCCQQWKDKYTKLREKHSKVEDGRNALRKGVKLLEQEIAKLESENLTLKKACEDERMRAESEKEDKVKESAVRVNLEYEVSNLKSQILLLQENGGLASKGVDEEVANLLGRVSEAETEINQLKELLEEERKRVDAEKEKVEKERKKAEDAIKKVNAEKNKASEEKRLVDIERKKAEELRLRLETLKREVDDAKSKLAFETAKYEQENKKLKAERENITKERKRADMEKANAADQRKLAEENWKKAMGERSRADDLSQQLDQNKKRLEELEKQISALVSTRKLVEIPVEQPHGGHAELAGEVCSLTKKSEISLLEACKKLEELQQKNVREKKQVKSEMKKAEDQKKAAETYKRKAMEEKHRADHLFHELESNKKRLEEVQKEIQKLVSSGKVFESSHPASGESLEVETAEIKLLRKQLKFERMRVKHAKEVAKLEVGRSCILRQEVQRLKQDFIQFSQRFDLLDNCFFHKCDGINNLEKKGSFDLGQEHFHLKPSQLILHTQNELVKPSCTTSTATGGSAPLKQKKRLTIPLPPVSGEMFLSPTTGIDSNLELLLRGSNRKMLQSSAINSSSASFSDRPLVGSQGKGTCSVTTSAKLAQEQNIEPTTSRLSGDTRKSYDEKLAVGAENSIGSPVKSGVTQRSGSHRKRKRVPDAVKSIEDLYSAGQNWHQQVLQKLSLLHRILDGESPKSLEERVLVQGNMYSKPVRPCKKKKASNRHGVAIHHLCDPCHPKTNVETLSAEGSDFCKHASIQTAPVLKDDIGDLLGSKLHLPGNCEEVFGHDYMKLVQLDNDIDENRFCKAIEKPISPLSPTLCNIEFACNETSETEMGTSRPLPDESLYEGFSKAEHDVLPSCNFDVVSLEIDSNNRNIKDLQASKILSFGMTKSPNENCENLGNNGSYDSDVICASNASSGLISNSSTASAAPRNEELKIPCESRSAAFNGFPKYFIVPSNNTDDSTVSKILCVSNDCMSQCSSNSSLELLIQNILLSFQKADNLSSGERVSVFFSLLLHYTSEIANGASGNSECDSLRFIDSFAQQMRAVLNDADTRSMFLESCDLYKLVALTEDFLQNRRILVYDDVSHGLMFEHDSRAKVVLNDNCIFWSIQAASTDLLFAGGLLLASICAAVDQIGFICEVSCNIFSMRKISSLLLLRLLHVFAYLCGPKYFTLEDFSLEMSVLKCFVVLLERKNLSSGCCFCLPSVAGTSMKISACSSCPFMDGVVSIDFIVSVLLGKLQNYALSDAEQQDTREALDSSHCQSMFQEMRTKDVQCPGEAVPLNFVSNGNLCYFIDMLSLLELAAISVSWDWTFGNIVMPLFQMLDSCVQEHFFPAIITLLGQLGRLGVDANGYEDSGVENIRKWLSAFISRITFRNFGLPIQFASVFALVGLIARSFEEVVEAKFDTFATGSQSVATDRIRKWFSLLSNEQQSSFRSLHNRKSGC